MTTKIKLLFLLLLILLFPSVLSAEQQTSNFYKVKLGKVIDGDTFKVYLSCSYKLFCKGVSVRVRGIDTPELKSRVPEEKAKALAAKKFTKKFLTGKKITLKKCHRDKYFRLLCDVYADNKSLAEALLNEKLAVSYLGGAKQ